MTLSQISTSLFRFNTRGSFFTEKWWLVLQEGVYGESLLEWKKWLEMSGK